MTNNHTRRNVLLAATANAAVLTAAGCAKNDVADGASSDGGQAAPAKAYQDPDLDTLHLVDPEYRDALGAQPVLNVNADNLSQVRSMIAELDGGDGGPLIGERHEIPESEASVLIYQPPGPASESKPAIVYMHGGGYVLGTAAEARRLLC